MLSAKRLATAPLRTGLLGRIGRNLAFLLGGKVAAGLVSLAYIVMSARALGPNDFGVLTLAYGFAMLVSGVIRIQPGPAMVRFGALALANESPWRIHALWRRMALVEFSAAVVAALTAGMASAIVGPRLGWPWAWQGLAAFVSIIVLANVRSTPSGILQLFGRFDVVALQIALGPLVRLAGALITLAFGFGLRGFLIAWAVAMVAEWSVMWGMGWKVAQQRLRRGAGATPTSFRHADPPTFWRFVVATNVDLALHDLTKRLPSVTIGWFLGPAAAGLYAVGMRVTNVLAQPAQMFGDAAYAELARHLAYGEGEAGLRRSLVVAARWTLVAILPLLAIVLLFARQIATAFAGREFAAAGTIIPWLAIACLIRLAVPTLSSTLLAQGKAGRSLIASVAANIALYPLLPLLLVHFSLIGAGIHAIVQASTALTLLLLFAFVPSHGTRKEPWLPLRAVWAKSRLSSKRG